MSNQVEDPKEKLKITVEGSINEFRYKVWVKKEEFSSTLKRANLFLEIDKNFKKVGVGIGGIHYYDDIGKQWFPVALTDLLQPYSGLNQIFDPKCHLSLKGTLEWDEEVYIICSKDIIDKVANQLNIDTSKLADLFGARKFNELRNYICDVVKDCQTKTEVINTLKQSIGTWIIETESLDRGEKLRKELKKLESNTLLNVFLCSFFLKLIIGYEHEKGDICFYCHPLLGGIAFAFDRETGKSCDVDENFIKLLLRRLLILMGMLHNFSRRDEYDEIEVDSSIFQIIADKLEDFIATSQIPVDNFNDDLTIERELIKVVPHIGNRREHTPKYRLIIPLAVKSREAFNYLYLENAMQFVKIEQFINGWFHGKYDGNNHLFADIKSEEIDIKLDVYVHPSLREFEARIANPYKSELYAYKKLRIQEGSNFDFWKRKVLPSSINSFPAVIYRNSEMVGPSVLLSEVATQVVAHFLECSKHHKTEVPPIRVLNLFSGSGSLEVTLQASLMKNELRKISILSIDLNPCLLKNLDERIKSISHVVPLDIFKLTSSSFQEQKTIQDFYSQKYDIVIADPPHYLNLDFLFQRIQIKNDSAKIINLIEHLADCSKCFLLYFSHKEQEWLSFFVHQILTKALWGTVLSILVGDERMALCFCKPVQQPIDKKDREVKSEDNDGIDYRDIECIKDISQKISGVFNDNANYNFKERGLKVVIYDTYFRPIE